MADRLALPAYTFEQFRRTGRYCSDIGAALQFEMAGMDFSFNTRRLEAIRRSSAAYLPGLAEAKVMEIWRGLRPCTPDGLPVIGRSQEFSNLILATGHAMLGISLGPVTGKLVAQLACEEKTDIDLHPLRLRRF